MSTRGERFVFLAFEWNVDKAKELVAGKEPDQASLDGIDGMLSMIRINKEHAMSDEVDLSRPLIAVPITVDGETSNVVIDGWHRIYKARQQGLATLPSYVLSAEEELVCRTSGVLPHEQTRKQKLDNLLDWMKYSAHREIDDFVCDALEEGWRVHAVVEVPLQDSEHEEIFAIANIPNNSCLVELESTKELILY